MEINREDLDRLIRKNNSPFWRAYNGSVRIDEYEPDEADLDESIRQANALIDACHNGILKFTCFTRPVATRKGGDSTRYSFEYSINCNVNKAGDKSKPMVQGIGEIQMGLLQQNFELQKRLDKIELERQIEDLEDELDEMKEGGQGQMQMINGLMQQPLIQNILYGLATKFGITVPAPVTNMNGIPSDGKTETLEVQQSKMEEQIHLGSQAISDLLKYDNKAGERLARIAELARLSQEITLKEKEAGNEFFISPYAQALGLLDMSITDLKKKLGYE